MACPRLSWLPSNNEWTPNPHHTAVRCLPASCSPRGRLVPCCGLERSAAAQPLTTRLPSWPNPPPGRPAAHRRRRRHHHQRAPPVKRQKGRGAAGSAVRQPWLTCDSARRGASDPPLPTNRTNAVPSTTPSQPQLTASAADSCSVVATPPPPALLPPAPPAPVPVAAAAASAGAAPAAAALAARACCSASAACCSMRIISTSSWVRSRSIASVRRSSEIKQRARCGQVGCSMRAA